MVIRYWNSNLNRTGKNSFEIPQLIRGQQSTAHHILPSKQTNAQRDAFFKKLRSECTYISQDYVQGVRKQRVFGRPGDVPCSTGEIKYGCALRPISTGIPEARRDLVWSTWQIRIGPKMSSLRRAVWGWTGDVQEHPEAESSAKTNTHVQECHSGSGSSLYAAQTG